MSLSEIDRLRAIHASVENNKDYSIWKQDLKEAIKDIYGKGSDEYKVFMKMGLKGDYRLEAISFLKKCIYSFPKKDKLSDRA